MTPEFTRGWGPAVSADGRALTLCIIGPRGSQTHANLEENGMIAVAFSPPTIARAVQVKGAAVWVRDPEPEELERAERHLAAFGAEVEQIGIPAHLARRLFAEADFVSVMMSIDEVFDQTPGPNAGQRL